MISIPLPKAARMIGTATVISISIYTLWYHGSKTIMDIAGLFALFYIFSNLQKVRDTLTKTDYKWLIILFSLFLSYALSFCIHGLDLDYEYSKITLRLCLISAAIYTIVRVNSDNLRNLENTIPTALMLCSLLGGAAGLYYWALSDFTARISVGTHLINIYAGTLTASTSATTVAIFFGNKSIAKKSIYTIAVLLGSLGIFASGSRAAFISLFLIGIIYFLSIKESRKNRIFYLGLLSMLIILSIQIPAINKSIDRTVQNVSEYFQDETYLAARNTSIGIRLEMWQAAIHAFLSKPIVGNGSSELAPLIKDQLSSGERSSLIGKFTHVHNDFFQALLSRGVLGGIILILLFYYPYRYRKSIPSSLRHSLIMIIASYILCGLTDAMLVNTMSLSFYLITVSIIFSMRLNFRDKNIET